MVVLAMLTALQPYASAKREVVNTCCWQQRVWSYTNSHPVFFRVSIFKHRGSTSCRLQTQGNSYSKKPSKALILLNFFSSSVIGRLSVVNKAFIIANSFAAGCEKDTFMQLPNPSKMEQTFSTIHQHFGNTFLRTQLSPFSQYKPVCEG